MRIPITRDVTLWNQAVEIGRELIWLHSFGERFVDEEAGRPRQKPRLSKNRPIVLVDIPDTSERMPGVISYEVESEAVRVGDGIVAPVPVNVWEYKVSGRRIVEKWFAYRKKNPVGLRTSPLDCLNAECWSADMTTQLLDLLNVLGRCVELEPSQASLLDGILDGHLITVDDLTSAGVLPVPDNFRKALKRKAGVSLWDAEEM